MTYIRPICTIAATITLLAADAMATDLRADLAKCAKVSAGIERLSCFDEIAQRRGTSETARSTTFGPGNWVVMQERSKIDDSENVFIHVPAKDAVRSRFNRQIRPYLWMACREDTTSLWIDMAEFLTTSETAVTYRIDKLKAVTRTFAISSDHKAFGLWNAPHSVAFIRDLLDHEAFLVQVTPYGEPSVFVEFAIAQLRQAINPLAAACHWSPDPPKPHPLPSLDGLKPAPAVPRRQTDWRPEDDLSPR